MTTSDHEDDYVVRLVGGSSVREGRVEIYRNGEWGTVCDDSWDDADARVVCRQLGLPYTNARSYSSGYFGQGRGPIFLDEVQCSGWELALATCPSNPWNVNDCVHVEDAGVRCGELPNTHDRPVVAEGIIPWTAIQVFARSSPH